MEQIMHVLQMIVEKGPAVLSAIIGLLSAVIAVCLLIPGEQPEKALQAIVDFLKKFSRKPLE
jgi:acetolactate synthase small subunit